METLLKFDTVKLTTNRIYISQINDAIFSHDIDPTTGELISVEYNSNKHQNISPFKLYIRVNYRSNYMTVEFSSKILLKDYPKLISDETFRQCFQNIETLGICTFNIDAIIDNCHFSKLHITKDVDLCLTSEILNRLNLCTKEYRRYKWYRYKDGISFSRDVKASDCRESMILYNKEVELTLSKNKPFLTETGASSSIISHFKGKTRFEVQLENKRKIQKELGISNTDYQSVMLSKKNIILVQFDKIFGVDVETLDSIKINNIADYYLWNTILYHNFDLKSIAQDIKDRHLYSHKTKGAMGKQMKKISVMIKSHLNQTYNTDNVINKIKELIK